MTSFYVIKIKPLKPKYVKSKENLEKLKVKCKIIKQK